MKNSSWFNNTTVFLITAMMLAASVNYGLYGLTVTDMKNHISPLFDGSWAGDITTIFFVVCGVFVGLTAVRIEKPITSPLVKLLVISPLIVGAIFVILFWVGVTFVYYADVSLSLFKLTFITHVSGVYAMLVLTDYIFSSPTKRDFTVSPILNLSISVFLYYFVFFPEWEHSVFDYVMPVIIVGLLVRWIDLSVGRLEAGECGVAMAFLR